MIRNLIYFNIKLLIVYCYIFNCQVKNNHYFIELNTKTIIDKNNRINFNNNECFKRINKYLNKTIKHLKVICYNNNCKNGNHSSKDIIYLPYSWNLELITIYNCNNTLNIISHYNDNLNITMYNSFKLPCLINYNKNNDSFKNININIQLYIEPCVNQIRYFIYNDIFIIKNCISNNKFLNSIKLILIDYHPNVNEKNLNLLKYFIIEIYLLKKYLKSKKR